MYPGDEIIRPFVEDGLEAKYRQIGGPERTTHIDPLGYGRWIHDFLSLLAEDRTPAQAWTEVEDMINAIVGTSERVPNPFPGEAHGPAPAPVPPSTPGTPDLSLKLITRADFLTQRVPGYREGFTDYQHYDADRRRAVRAGAKAEGYTHVIFGPIFEGGAHTPPGYPTGDYLDQPVHTAQACRELYEDGLWPVWLVGFEDSPRAQAKYGFGGLIEHTRTSIEAAHQWLSKVVIGVEATEWIGRMLGVPKTDPRAFRKLLAVMAGISVGFDDIVFGVHLNGDLYGPPGGEEAWLRELRDAGGRELWFQYGFGLTPAQLKARTREVFPRIWRNGVEPVPAEYSLEAKNVATSQELGEACLEGDPEGRGQFANGGPGIDPDAPPPGEVGDDEIDPGEITFHRLDGREANHVRTWPIESRLVVTFDRERKQVHLRHTPLPSWPIVDGVDSNGWIVVTAPDGRWHAWTWDYFRPGSPAKPWSRFDLARDTFAVFPGWTYRARAGDVVGFMQSRIARTVDANGEGRSNIVRVEIPFV